MSKEDNRPGKIPLAVERAEPMTDKEFSRIRQQNRLIWAGTMISVPIGIGMSLLGVGFGIIPNAVVLGFAFHFAARTIWKDGTKAGSIRYQSYKGTYELNKHRKNSS